jgi:hypothetical protein
MMRTECSAETKGSVVGDSLEEAIANARPHVAQPQQQCAGCMSGARTKNNPNQYPRPL